jgi:2'-5' RNA ligase
VSVHFFGELSSTDVDRIAAAMESIEGQRANVASGGIDFFPPGGRRPPRVVYLALADGVAPVMRLQSRFAAIIRRLGFELDPRGYSPHVTLARVRRPDVGLRAMSGNPDLRLLLDRLVLYESHPGPSGSDYVPLCTVMLEEGAN